MRNISEFSAPKSLPLGERLERGFPSKFLLFGEYGLIYDAMALSVPFPKFSGFLDIDSDQSHLESTAEIRKFYEYLKSLDPDHSLHFSFDLDRFENDLDQGLFFNSNIPQQYGLGSSGALVAALFNRYAVNSIPKEELAPELLKADFSILESYFHGKSSGLDPLISFLNKPILIDSNKQICPIEFDMNKSGLAMALIDTKTTGATGPLVQHFIDLFNLPEFEHAFYNQFIPANNGCIESLLIGDKPNFFKHVEKLVKFQVYQFHQMIPVNFHRIITFAHCEKVYIKLLGSGGGGFLLAFAESQNILDQWSKKRGIEIFKLVCN